MQEPLKPPNTDVAESVSAGTRDPSDKQSEEMIDEPFGPVLSRQQDRYTEHAETEEPKHIDAEEHKLLNKKEKIKLPSSEGEATQLAQPLITATTTDTAKEINPVNVLNELLTSKKDGMDHQSNTSEISGSTEQAIVNKSSVSMPEHSDTDINLKAVGTDNRMVEVSELNRQNIKELPPSTDNRMAADSEPNRQNMKAGGVTLNTRSNQLHTPQGSNQRAMQQLNNILPEPETLANQSEEIVHSARQGVPDGGLFSSDSENSQRRGKTIPPSGNTLPSSQAFFANINEDGEQHGRILNAQVDAASEDSQQIRMANTTTPLPQLTESNAPIATNLDPAAATQRASDPLNNEDNKSFLIKTPVNSPEWSSQVGDRVRWLAKSNISGAELRLNPAELGSIEVKITVENDQTKVSFLTTTGAAKELIEASLPKLRDLLEHSGLQLEQSDVSQKNQTKQNFEEGFVNQNSHEDELESVIETAISSAPLKGQNQIDHYI